VCAAEEKLSVVKSRVRERKLTEDRAAALPLITDDTTHPELLAMKLSGRIESRIMDFWSAIDSSVRSNLNGTSGFCTPRTARLCRTLPSADHSYAIVDIFIYDLSSLRDRDRAVPSIYLAA
jgi:hypothetical protein